MNKDKWTIKFAGSQGNVSFYKLYSGRVIWWNFCGIYAGMENVKLAIKKIEEYGK